MIRQGLGVGERAKKEEEKKKKKTLTSDQTSLQHLLAYPAPGIGVPSRASSSPGYNPLGRFVGTPFREESVAVVGKM